MSTSEEYQGTQFQTYAPLVVGTFDDQGVFVEQYPIEQDPEIVMITPNLTEEVTAAIVIWARVKQPFPRAIAAKYFFHARGEPEARFHYSVAYDPRRGY